MENTKENPLEYLAQFRHGMEWLEGDYPNCGKTVKAKLPSDVTTGYGPRLTAYIGELSFIKAMGRNDVQKRCASVLGISMATGTIQKMVDRNGFGNV